MKTQLSEKINLLQEVHHRVKNNISNIEGLLSLQAVSSENPEVKMALQDSVSRVQSMRILYDRLLIGKDYRDVPVKAYLESIIDSLRDVFANVKNVVVKKNISEFSITSKKAVSVGMIINELITNIYKYAFIDRNEGMITISIEKDGNTVTLAVRDNGIGIEKRTDGKLASGFGLTIVKILVEQLKGTYGIKNDNGTKSVVKFDL
ncbi:MAG: sensor histidine kinase [Spirochaetes bacterium]|nr:sensor histidine kinase [Spirochaetota bacterium]